jgi:hypothetical protein
MVLTTQEYSKKGADLVIFPELFTSGYGTTKHAEYAEKPDGLSFQVWQKLVFFTISREFRKPQKKSVLVLYMASPNLDPIQSNSLKDFMISVFITLLLLLDPTET